MTEEAPQTLLVDELAEAMQGRVDRAMFAVSRARLMLARLLDNACLNGLADDSPLAADTLAVMREIDEAFPKSTDQATGLPLAMTNAAQRENEDG